MSMNLFAESSKVIECTLHSSRTGTLLISIGKSRTLKIIQAYAPTSLCEEEELEDFYLEVDEALKKKSTYTVLMGDFNAKIGRSCIGGKLIGKFCLGDRNDRGERLATFAETNRLVCGFDANELDGCSLLLGNLVCSRNLSNMHFGRFLSFLTRVLCSSF